jgi:hypothetical protein
MVEMESYQEQLAGCRKTPCDLVITYLLQGNVRFEVRCHVNSRKDGALHVKCVGPHHPFFVMGAVWLRLHRTEACSEPTVNSRAHHLSSSSSL